MALRSIPTWTPAELAEAAKKATDAFVRDRLEEGLGAYSVFVDATTQRVSRLHESTNNLRSLSPQLLTEDTSWLNELRYLAGPPISFDDLQTMVGARLGAKTIDKDVAARVVTTIKRTLDPYRFAWVGEERDPTEVELERAIGWTAGLKAVEQLRTHRRNDESSIQEQQVKLALADAGYTRVNLPGKELGALDDLARGTFTDELRVAGSRADVPIRLFDGRLLAIECKASNSAVNSVKRLNREVGGKADQWRAAYGRQVVPCAVISGVFSVPKLLEAQNDQGVFLVWQHDLHPLIRFVLADDEH